MPRSREWGPWQKRQEGDLETRSYAGTESSSPGAPSKLLLTSAIGDWSDRAGVPEVATPVFCAPAANLHPGGLAAAVKKRREVRRLNPETGIKRGVEDKQPRKHGAGKGSHVIRQ